MDGDVLVLEEVVVALLLQAVALDVDGCVVDGDVVETRLEPGATPRFRQLTRACPHAIK